MKTAGEKVVDCDQGWEWEHMVQRLAEIVDLNNGERALMAVWNRYNTQFVEAWKGLRVGEVLGFLTNISTASCGFTVVEL